MLEDCVKDNYYARFHIHSYHACREMHFYSRLDVKFPSQWSRKCRSRGHGVCLKSVSRTITMQGFILTAITAAEKCTFILFRQSIGAGNVGQGLRVMVHA